MAHGRTHGLRPPTPEERARASGIHRYALGLGLAGRDLYDAIGNHFDPRCLQQRLMPLLRPWALGLDVGRPVYPDPAAILAIFDNLRAAVRRLLPFVNLVRVPFRDDVVAQLVADGLLPADTSQRQDDRRD